MKLQKTQMFILVLSLVVGLVGPIFGMSFLLTPVVLLLGLGLTGLYTILADKP